MMLIKKELKDYKDKGERKGERLRTVKIRLNVGLYTYYINVCSQYTGKIGDHYIYR